MQDTASGSVAVTLHAKVIATFGRRMRSAPLVSVIIPFFNAQPFLEEAIRSVLRQSYTAWEILLVDDGSSDGSSEVARRYAARSAARVRCFAHDGHASRGPSAARNLGLYHARGEYIALLDADDVWLPHKLERQVALLEAHPTASLIYGRSQYWHSWATGTGTAADDEIPDLGVHIPLDRVIAPPELLILNYPLGQAAAPPPCDVTFRRTMLERVGGFEDHFVGVYQIYEDQVFLAKCYLTESVYVSSECWDRYRQHAQSASAVATREGHYPEARALFLEWFQHHLSDHRIDDPEVWQAFHLAHWPYLPAAEQRRIEARVRSLALDHAVDEPVDGKPTFDGSHDVVNREEISGWVWDPRRPSARITVSIYDHDQHVITLTANRFRRDLLAAKKGDGYHAFTCRLPPWLRDGRPHEIWVKVAGSNVALASTPQSITCAPA